MSEDQFTKLFKYMQEFRKEVDGRFNEHDKRFDEVINLIDGYGGKIDSYTQEIASTFLRKSFCYNKTNG